jgi:ketopantoate reductase
MLPVVEKLSSDFSADICLVTVRCEQIGAVLPDLTAATRIRRIVFLTNHAGDVDDQVASVGRTRIVRAFPGVAGNRDGAIVRYLDIPQQHTVVEQQAPAIVSLFRQAGFLVDPVRDMDAWLNRHAVFITSIAGSLYDNECDARKLAHNPDGLRRFILAVRQGWEAQDRRGIAPAPIALRVILCWVPTFLSTRYWSRLLASPRGDIYFARHARLAAAEMAALAQNVRTFLNKGEAPELRTLLASIDRWRG